MRKKFMNLTSGDLITLASLVCGFIVTVQVMKSEMKSLKDQMNGIGGKVNKLADKDADRRTDIEVLKVRLEHKQGE